MASLTHLINIIITLEKKLLMTNIFKNKLLLFQYIKYIFNIKIR